MYRDEDMDLAARHGEEDLAREQYHEELEREEEAYRIEDLGMMNPWPEDEIQDVPECVEPEEDQRWIMYCEQRNDQAEEFA